MLTQNSLPYAELAIRSSIGLVDRFVVMDGGSTDGTDALAASLGAEVVRKPWPGRFDVQYSALIDYLCQNGSEEPTWMLILDHDEVVTGELDRKDVENWQRQGIDNVWCQRKWIVRHRGRLRYIASPPHSPDWMNRLIKVAPNVRFKGEVHAHVEGVRCAVHAPTDKLCLLHLHLLLNSRDMREKRMEQYRAANPRSAYSWYYLYEDYGYWLSDLGRQEALWLPDMEKIALTDSAHSLTLQRFKYWATPKGFFHHVALPHGRRLRSRLTHRNVTWMPEGKDITKLIPPGPGGPSEH